MRTYLRFTFCNVEPLKITDDSKSQRNQSSAKTYVPGTALRGAIIGEFLRQGVFETFKTALLSEEVSFLNAYPIVNGRELLPTAKGFYEDRRQDVTGKKSVENLLINGHITPGFKRAAMGQYCYFEGDCLYFTHLNMGNDMKINRQQKNVFRQQYIKPGYLFSAYVAVPRENGALAEAMLAVIQSLQERQTLVLGGNRGQGYGQCRITTCSSVNTVPFSAYCGEGAIADCAYMLLLSDMAMVNEEGALVGLDFSLLKQKLRLEKLQSPLQSTSVVEVRGYNRTWQAWTPSVNMYEKGSVFKLEFPGETISAEAREAIAQEGIGIRGNEGYGRVLLFSAETYEALNKKLAMDVEEADETVQQLDFPLRDQEKATLQIIARGYYQNQIQKAKYAYLAKEANSLKRFRLEKSQLGTIEALAYANLFAGEAAFDRIAEYFGAAILRENKNAVQKQTKSRVGIADYIDKQIRQKSLLELYPELSSVAMGIQLTECFSPEEICRFKLELLIAQIKYENRGGAGND